MASCNFISIILFLFIGVLSSRYSLTHLYTLSAVLVLVLLVGCRIVYSAILYPTLLTPLRRLPTPKHRSYIRGNVTSITRDSPERRVSQWAKTIPNDGLIRYYIAGNLERVLVTSPQTIKDILVTRCYDFQKPEILRQQLERMVGNGLLFAEGGEHKIQRKSLLPAFSFRHIKDLYPIFWAKAIEAVAQMEIGLAKDDIVSVDEWANRIMLDIIGLAGMGHDFGSVKDPNNELSQHYRKMIQKTTRTSTKIFTMIGVLFVGLKTVFSLPLREFREIAEAGSYIRHMAQNVVMEKMSKLDKGKVDSVDVVSVALSSGIFTEKNLVDQMMTMLGAGHETTASALQYAIYALCRYPKIQDRLRAEIRANIPSIETEEGSLVSAASIEGLPYLSAFCNETLRLFPSVPLVGRSAVRDTSISGIFIPKGTHLIICPEITNQSEELWGPDASQFNPERWLAPGAGTTGGSSSNFAMSTFIHGPRGCIGQAFARGELQCVVAAIVGRFQVEFKDPNYQLSKAFTVVTSAPKGGLEARFKSIEGW